MAAPATSMTPREQRLAESRDMDPVSGTIDVHVPAQEFWSCFRRANFWPRWNVCFLRVVNRDLVKGRRLLWIFRPIRWWYPYLMFSVAKIVEVEPGRKVTWEVTALPGFYARHTYSIQDLGGGVTRFGSWEKATGWGFRLMKRFWLKHFVFVKDASLEGAVRLEDQYRRTQRLDLQSVRRVRQAPRWARIVRGAMALVLAAGLGVAVWLYAAYARLQPIRLAPGVHAILGGGGNSLLVESGGEALLVDTKFPPASRWLRRWIDSHARARVTSIVNTHYHYDHTQGNTLYPGARIHAWKDVRGFMLEDEPEFWKKEAGLPTDPVSDATVTLTMGSETVVLTHPSRAHTAGDLWVFLPRHDIVATGDLVFNTYYPYFDTDPRKGAWIPEQVRTIRRMALDHPGATFLPGHGPPATAQDLNRYADYLETLWREVGQALRSGMSRDEAEQRIDLSSWPRRILPSPQDWLHPDWFTARDNIRRAYLIASREVVADARPSE